MQLQAVKKTLESFQMKIWIDYYSKKPSTELSIPNKTESFKAK